MIKKIALPIIFIYSTISLASPLCAKPDAVELMHDLKRASRTDYSAETHGKIYSKILKDTSVLSFSGLSKEIERTAREVWYKRYIRGNQLNRDEAEPLPGNNFPVFKGFVTITDAMEGKSKVKTALWIIPHGPTTHRLIPDLIRNGPVTSKLLLRKIKYKNDGSNKMFRNDASDLSRPLYEIYRRYKNTLDSRITNQISNFARKTLTVQKDLSGWKTFAVSYLLDQGESLKSIESKLVQPDRYYDYSDKPRQESWTMSGEHIKQEVVEEGAKWRKEYPKWPLNEDQDDTTPPLHQTQLDWSQSGHQIKIRLVPQNQEYKFQAQVRTAGGADYQLQERVSNPSELESALSEVIANAPVNKTRQVLTDWAVAFDLSMNGKSSDRLELKETKCTIESKSPEQSIDYQFEPKNQHGRLQLKIQGSTDPYQKKWTVQSEGKLRDRLEKSLGQSKISRAERMLETCSGAEL